LDSTAIDLYWYLTQDLCDVHEYLSKPLENIGFILIFFKELLVDLNIEGKEIDQVLHVAERKQVGAAIA